VFVYEVGMIKIDFEFQTPHGKFADALHLPEDHTFTEAEIQAMKEQRRDNWIAVVTAPPVEQPETTKEIGGEVYQKLEGVPPSGAKLVEIDGVWYVKV
jgi:hypothetical protein